MKFWEYVRDRFASGLTTLISIALVSFVLTSVSVERDLIILVDIVIALCALGSFSVSYLVRRSFWTQVQRVLSDDEQVLNVTELVNPPSYPEGLRAWDALDAISVAGRKKVAAAAQDTTEYREYIDSWVHEVKTPLAATKLMCESAPEVSSTKVLHELERIEGYVDQALFYARSGSVEHDYLIRKTTVGTLAKNVVRTHKRLLIDARMSITLGQGMGLEVFTDVKWFEFCLGQIIQNAVKYRCQKDPRTGEHRISRIAMHARLCNQDSAHEYVQLRVFDNGYGIPPQDLPRVFDKAFVGENGRLPGQAHSTGLGLYLVKRLCTKMGLRVHIRSQQFEWTELIFEFPTDRTRYLDEFLLMAEFEDVTRVR